MPLVSQEELVGLARLVGLAPLVSQEELGRLAPLVGLAPLEPLVRLVLKEQPDLPDQLV